MCQSNILITHLLHIHITMICDWSYFEYYPTAYKFCIYMCIGGLLFAAFPTVQFAANPIWLQQTLIGRNSYIVLLNLVYGDISNYGYFFIPPQLP